MNWLLPSCYWLLANGIGHFRRIFDIPMAITGLGNYRLRCFLQQTRSMVVQLWLNFDVVFHTEWTLTEVLIPRDMCPTVSPSTDWLASLWLPVLHLSLQHRIVLDAATCGSSSFDWLRTTYWKPRYYWKAGSMPYFDRIDLIRTWAD